MHEKEIIEVIEKAGFEGIHVRGMVDKGLSPKTLKKYLPILENEKRLIVHEKYKNKDVYHIRHGDELSYDKSNLMFRQSLEKIEGTILQAIKHAEKWGVAEQLEVYQHAVNVITLNKYLKQFVVDSLDVPQPSIPNKIDNYTKRLDELATKVNKSINLFFTPLALIQLDNTISESLDYLDKISKRKRKPRTSKHITKLKPKLKPIYERLKKFDEAGGFDSIKSKKQ